MSDPDWVFETTDWILENVSKEDIFEEYQKLSRSYALALGRLRQVMAGMPTEVDVTVEAIRDMQERLDGYEEENKRVAKLLNTKYRVWSVSATGSKELLVMQTVQAAIMAARLNDGELLNVVTGSNSSEDSLVITLTEN